MAKLAVRAVRANDSQERLGDELYVKIDGQAFDLNDGFELGDGSSWSDGDFQQFGNIVSGDVGRSAVVELWEKGVGADDLIDRDTVNFRAGDEFNQNFSDASANYTLTLDWI